MLSFYAVHQPLEAKQEDLKRNIKEIETFDFGNQPEYIAEGTGRTKMRQDNPSYACNGRKFGQKRWEDFRLFAQN